MGQPPCHLSLIPRKVANSNEDDADRKKEDTGDVPWRSLGPAIQGATPQLCLVGCNPHELYHLHKPKREIGLINQLS